MFYIIDDIMVIQARLYSVFSHVYIHQRQGAIIIFLDTLCFLFIDFFTISVQRRVKIFHKYIFS